jgi:LPPG:FO 2-phospho-L-lactate transferase
MTDAPVRTKVRRGEEWLGLQEWLIRQHGSGPVEAVAFEGADHAEPSPEVLEAIATARAVIVGPSNPVISIGPILALPGLRDALAATPAAVVSVSPIVGGVVLKGPTATCMQAVGGETTNRGVADYYGDLLGGMVADLDVPSLVTLVMNVELAEPATRKAVAERALGFAEALA